ncbi:MAG: transcriptional regulator [Proteobacteria bacterium]|nr:transcriptional regulator [Pseudomonadota bacterium]
MMKMHPKKRIEIIIELPLQGRITQVLDTQDVFGYTIFSAQGGRGQEGPWQRDGIVGDSGRMVAIVCIVDPARLDGILTQIYAVIERQIGIVSVSDVEVVRADHF